MCVLKNVLILIISLDLEDNSTDLILTTAETNNFEMKLNDYEKISTNGN